jgi:hypothetical protein
MAITLAVAPPSPPHPIKHTREPLRLPFSLTCASHTLSTGAATVKPSRHAIAGRTKLLVVGEHLIGLLASSLASRSACTRIPCPGPLLPPPDRATRTATEARPSASISATAASPSPKPSPNRCRGGEQASPPLPLIFPEPWHLPAMSHPAAVRPKDRMPWPLPKPPA